MTDTASSRLKRWRQRRRKQCPYEASIGDRGGQVTYMCSARKGHDGPHFSVWQQMAWVPTVTAELVSYDADKAVRVMRGGMWEDDPK